MNIIGVVLTCRIYVSINARTQSHMLLLLLLRCCCSARLRMQQKQTQTCCAQLALQRMSCTKHTAQKSYRSVVVAVAATMYIWHVKRHRHRYAAVFLLLLLLLLLAFFKFSFTIVPFYLHLFTSLHPYTFTIND